MRDFGAAVASIPSRGFNAVAFSLQLSAVDVGAMDEVFPVPIAKQSLALL